MTNFRTEKDSLGEVRVPEEALWGAQTQRAIENFPVSGQPMPPAFIAAVVRVKQAAADANASLGLLDNDRSFRLGLLAMRLICRSLTPHRSPISTSVQPFSRATW